MDKPKKGLALLIGLGKGPGAADEKPAGTSGPTAKSTKPKISKDPPGRPGSMSDMLSAGEDESEEGAESGDDYGDNLAFAGEEAVEALKTGDGKAFAEALCAIMDIHNSKG